MKPSPFPFQKKIISRIEKFNGRSLISAEMGLGKTPISLWCLKRNPSWLPAVVVCPASVKYVWEAEAKNFLGWRSVVLEGQTPYKSSHFKSNTKLTIINYDILRFWLKWLKQQNPQTIIIDESQYIGNPTTKMTKAVKELCREVSHVLALSGTPLLNRPIELFPTLNIIQPKVFPARRVFGDDYCGPEWTPWGLKYNGATNTKKLHRLLTNSCMVRKRKAEVLKELPSKMRQVIPVSIRDRGEYNKANDNFLDWLRSDDPAAAKRAARAVSLSKISYLLQLTAKLKLKAVVEWINDYLQNTDDKIIIGAIHKKMIRALERRVDGDSLVIDGSVNPRHRKMVVDQFQNDKSRRVLIGNIHAAGVGLTLTAASTVVTVELAWRPGDHIQFEDRCHRIGADKTVWCYYLVAHDTLEEKLCRVLQKKQGVLSAVLDGGKTAEDLDVFNQLCNELRNS